MLHNFIFIFYWGGGWLLLIYFIYFLWGGGESPALARYTVSVCVHSDDLCDYAFDMFTVQIHVWKEQIYVCRTRLMWAEHCLSTNGKCICFATSGLFFWPCWVVCDGLYEFCWGGEMGGGGGSGIKNKNFLKKTLFIPGIISLFLSMQWLSMSELLIVRTKVDLVCLLTPSVQLFLDALCFSPVGVGWGTLKSGFQ